MKLFRWLCLFIVLLLLVACTGPKVAVRSPHLSGPVVILEATPAVIATARQMVGVPYLYGGANPGGFDCSGLVSYAYRRAGIPVPRTSSEQFRQAKPVSLAKLQAGDLLFFRLAPPKISHVAIYDRAGRFIHAPASGKQVSYASLDNPYWRKHLVGAGRF